MTKSAFKSARQSLGLSTSGMAAALGMNRRSIQRMEAGTQLVSPRTAAQVDNLLRLNGGK